MAEEVVRNIQVKLGIPESRHDDVDATFDEFQHAAQHVSDYGWDPDLDTLIKAKNKLHDATYSEVRDQTTLQASLVQSARNLAADALSNCKELLDDDKNTSKPEFKGSVVVYNRRTITYNDDHVTLATVDDRVKHTGTRSAHLTIESIGDRFAQGSRHRLHDVSNAIIREARENGCTHIAFERLKYIWTRISNASKFQQWAFREIQRQVTYKAEAYGIGVEKVAPQYTSQRCSHGKCGFTHEDNRDGDEFECLKCGKELHSDYNAARNVAWRLVQNWLKSGAGRVTSQLALKSGTVNANGEFSASA